MSEENIAMVLPQVSPHDASRIWEQYVELENEVLQPDDFMYVVRYLVGNKPQAKPFTHDQIDQAHNLMRRYPGAKLEKRKLKSAYRKLGRFFGLWMPERDGGAEIELHEIAGHIVKIEHGNGYIGTIYMDDSLSVRRAEYSVTVVAPGGQTFSGVGACSIKEGRKFKHHDHDIIATAFTRALNRTIADVVGWGEVSAEEVIEPLKISAPDNEVITDVGQFVGWIMQQGMTVNQACEKLGVNHLGEVKDYKTAQDVLSDEDTDEEANSRG